MKLVRVNFILLSLFLSITSVFAKNHKSEQPNVILIMVDDQGYGDVACLGNEYIQTPNMDALHKKSARFTNYHVSPTCAPTRGAILTGHHSNRAGVWHTVNGRSLILEREVTMAQVFQDNGYNTSMFGKWHLGDNYPSRPQDKGFQEVLTHGGGGLTQTMDYWNNDYFDDMYWHNGELEQYEGYCTDVWFENAMEHIDKQGDKPFFCYLSTNAAHSPYFVEEKYAAPYRDNKAIPNPAFYGMITNVDDNIGKLLDFLEDKKLRDNTIIIFTTDNGTAAGAKVEGHRLDGFVVKGNNDGMRGIKASMYEGGHRVPLFIQWKDGGITKGQDIDELTAHYDIFPTLIDLCELKVDQDLGLDGQSLKPIIDGKKDDFVDRVVITNSQRNERPEAWRRTALMKGDWRMINGNELYDLATDPEQRTNIIAEHPEVAKELRAEYDAWWTEISPGYNDQPFIVIGHPTDNPTTIHCHDWHTQSVSPWHQRHIRQGYRDNGYWMIDVEKDGKYRFRLRRWPAESHGTLGGTLPKRKAVEGTTAVASKAGKALPIVEGGIKIQNFDVSSLVNPEEEYIEFTLDLLKGETTLNSWFKLEDKSTLGVYYIEVEAL